MQHEVPESEAEYPDSVAGDVFELHEEHPDFDHNDVWWMRYWPLGVLMFGTIAVISLPLAAVARLLLLFTDNRRVYGVSRIPHVFGGLCIAAIIGNLLGSFNEAMAEIEEDAAEKESQGDV